MSEYSTPQKEGTVEMGSIEEDVARYIENGKAGGAGAVDARRRIIKYAECLDNSMRKNFGDCCEARLSASCCDMKYKLDVVCKGLTFVVFEISIGYNASEWIIRDDAGELVCPAGYTLEGMLETVCARRISRIAYEINQVLHAERDAK